MGCSPLGIFGRKNESHSEKSSEYIVNNTQSLKIDARLFINKRTGLLSQEYTIGPKIGAGSFGFVREATSINLKKKRAIKSIKKSEISQSLKERAEFVAEVNILIKTDHPNVVKLYEFYEDDRYYHLVTEFLTGGELLDFIIKRKWLCEPIAAHFMSQLLSGVAYCHSNNIVHRDLKPENLLLDKDTPEALLKIIDFGTSKIFDPTKRMTHKYGTVYYVAPEVLQGYYNEKCDIWSCGVILYLLLSGRPPFYAKSHEEILEKILKGHYSFEEPEWDEVSNDAKDLINQMLHRNYNFRISALDAQKHPWFLSQKCNGRRLSSQVRHKSALANLQNFRAECKFQQAVLTFIASQLLTKEESKRFIEAFKAIDTNGDGKLSKEELLQSYKNEINELSAIEEIEKIMKKADSNNSGYIDYTEFVIASAKSEMLLCNSNLEQAFKAFDTDGNGKISAEELKGILGNGLKANDEIWLKLIKEVDENGDGEIDIDEFKTMMMKLINQEI
ncbi:hypothetical protein SteCoe_4854 [Stentor coeruleus]|uniref:Calcium-dependent protein kinase 1 n=1 Tax=Stentor coeruleus TaxID=5963 RepID=A0A1R2CTS6_9CILI|nr:hypothetical protein SteCoe_4854 [Stentor coeruleus]